MVQDGANRPGCSRVGLGMTVQLGQVDMTTMTAARARGQVEQLAWMTLAGGWLAAFTVTAGVANLVRPYRRAWAASRDERYRSAPSS
jgi:hypothetical protein